MLLTNFLNNLTVFASNNLEYVEKHWMDALSLGQAIANGSLHDSIQPTVNILLTVAENI